MTSIRKGGAFRRSSMALALEPRLLLDAAAATTAATTAAQTEAAKDTTPTLGVNHDNLDYVGTKTSTLDFTIWAYAPGTVTEFVNSSDGNTVYTLSTAAALWGSSSTTFLSVWSRDSSGNLTLVKSTSTDLSGATQLSLSGDGDSLLVVTKAGLSVYAVDNSTGTLTLEASLADTTLATATLTGDMVVSGDFILVSGVDDTGSGVLKVFKFSDGALTAVASLTGDTSTLLDNANDLTMSADGKYLFVSISGASSQVSVFSLAADGALTYLGAYGSDEGSTHYTTDLAISADGQNLYALEYDSSSKSSTVTAFTINTDGSLTRISQTTLSGQALALTVSGDDSTVFVTGVSSSNALTVYERDSSGTLVFVKTYSSSSFGNLTNLTTISLSADGETAYVAGTSWGTPALMTLKASALPTAYTEDSAAVALLPGGNLSDDDYSGGVLTIVRSAGASADDVFGFIDGNGLTYDAASGQILLDGSTVIANVTNSDGTLSVTFTAAATSTTAQEVLRQISYRNSSDNPTASSSSAALTVTYTDTSAQSASYEVSVGLTGVNDAPVLTTTGVAATFTAQGEAVKLFSSTVIDTVEAGQALWYFELTFDSNGAGEILVVGGEQIALDNATSGTASTASGLSYTITKTDSGTTVRVFVLTRADSATETAALINGLEYINTASELSSSVRNITLRVVESTTYPAVNESSATLSTAVTLAAATATNTAPTLTGADGVSYTEKAAAVSLLGADVAVSDAQMDGFNDGSGNYDRAVVTITLGEGYSSSDVLGFSADGYTLSGSAIQKDGVTIATWSQSDGTLTIRFTAANGTVPTTADVNAVLAGITYQNTSVDPAASVAVSVTLTDQAGSSSAVAAFSIAITSVNDTPTLSESSSAALGELVLDGTLSSISGLGTITDTAFSADGSHVWVSDSSGKIAVFAYDVDTGKLTYLQTLTAATGVTTITDLVVSADGKSVYAIVNSNLNLAVFTTAADGSLSLQQIIVSGSSNDWMIDQLKAVVVSEDGANVYLVNGAYIVTMTRDASTGALTYVSKIGDAWSEPYMWMGSALATNGDYVTAYSTYSGGTLIVWQRGTDGALTLVCYIRNGDSDASDNSVSLSGATQMAISEDGHSLYVASSSGVQLFTLTDSGAFTYVGLLVSGAVTDIQLSSSDDALYVSKSDGSVSVYSTANGTLTLSSSVSADSNAVALSVQGDGVVVVGAGIGSVHLERTSDPVLTIGSEAVLIAKTIDLSDAERDLADDYQGATVTFTSTTTATAVFGLADNETYTLDGTQIQKDGSTVATLVNGVLTFTAATTKTEAQAIMRLVTYQESGTVTVGTRSISVVLNDGSDNSASYTVALTVRYPNATPTVTATGSDSAYTASDAATSLFSGVTVSVGSGETDQLISALSFDIAGVGSRGVESLVVGGSPIVLVAGATGTLSNGLTYVVSASDGGLRLTLSSGAGIDAATAQALIAGIGYVSDDFASAGTRSITLVQIKDNGGTEQGGIDTASLSITSTVAVTAFNHAPQAEASVELPWLSAGNAYRVTLPSTLFADADADTGDTLTWSVSGLPAGLSFDPATRTISGTVTDPSGSYAIVVTVADGGDQVATLTLTLSTANLAPRVSASANVAAYTASDAATSLFGDVEVSTGSGESGQLVSALSFDIAGVGSRGVESLVVDGNSIVLVAGATGTLSNGLTYAVSASDGGLRLTLSSSAGINAGTAQALIAGISYVSDDSASAGTRSITLVQIKDNGGSEQGGSDTASLSITSTVTVASVNHAPQVGGGSGSVSATADQAFELTLTESLFSDPDGDVLQWTAVDLPTGLVFDAGTRTLSGTMAAGRYEITLRASDAQGSSVERTVVLVAQALATQAVTPAVQPLAVPFALLAGAEDRSSTDSPASPRTVAAVASSPSAGGQSSAPAFAENSPGAEANERITPLQELLDVLDVQHARETPSDNAMLLPDGRPTSLVVSAADGGLSSSVDRVTATWQSDVAENRRVAILPPGLFQSSAAVAGVSLRLADGRPLPAGSGIRLDLAQGRIVATGDLSTTVSLVLEVRTVDGQLLRIPVDLNADGEAAPVPEVSGKLPLSRLLRTHAVPDPYADAVRLLESLRFEVETQA